MSYGHFVDKTITPDEESIEATVGVKYSEWKEICSYLVLETNAKAEWKFYGKNYGWALRFTRKGRSIVALYPRVGDFYIQVILNAEQEKRVYSEISDRVLHEKLSATPTIVEGKWLYVTFLELGSVDLLVKLLNIRMEIAPNPPLQPSPLRCAARRR